MAGFRHALITATACFILLFAAGMSAMGEGIFNVSVLAVMAVISVLAAVADIFIRRKMALH
ncbi:hypothetical protein [Devosia sp. MC1541]|uniref:hypothetical protein n=1 Tax=Devosia sp. MC1541 TaxID=2725264 RepID=UPI00145D4964|nr:hypothetical protein [Devosia sp. MC1541]